MKKIENILSGNQIVLMPLYFMSIFIYSDFGISAVIGACLLSVLAFATFIIDFKNVKTKIEERDMLSFALCLFATFVIINFLRRLVIDRNIIYYIIILMDMLMLFISMDKSSIKKKSIEISIKCYLGFSIFVSSLIWIYKLFPHFYINNIIRFISESSKTYFLRLVGEGYGATIGSEISYTALAVMVGIFLVLALKKQFGTPKFTILMIFEFCALFFLQRRGEMLVTMMVILIVIIYRNITKIKQVIMKIIKNKKIVKIIVSISIVLVIVVVYLIIVIRENNMVSTNRYVNTFYDIVKGNSISNGRSPLYNIAIQLFKDNPIFGVGWGGFSEFASLSGNTHVTNAHCIYLQLISETGIVGFISMIYIIKTIAKNLLLVIKHTNEQNKSILIFSFSIIFSFFICGFIDNSLYYVTFVILLLYSISLLKYVSCNEKFK